MGWIYFETVLNDFCPQISSNAKYFFSFVQDRRLIVVIVYYFQIWNKKKEHIIISRVISSHMGPMYVVPSISFQTFFVQAFKIVVDPWDFSMLLLYILWDDWPIFMISGSKEQLQKQLEITLRKPYCHSWWISKMQSGREEGRYGIKFCFKLGKNVTETYEML